MKQCFFFFAMLANIAASAIVTVTPISTDYATKKVTFKVAWSGTVIPHNNRVWVWVDFCPVTGAVPAPSFSTATVSNPTKTGGNGTITGAIARGFFIQYANANNAGTTVTAILSNAPTGKFNWCAYGSDMPPNATVKAGGGYTLRGTSPFMINSSQSVASKTFPAGTCITSITDPTGRPDGFATPALTIGSQNSPSRCNAGAVTLSAIASGGTTTAMTYTWTIGGTPYTNLTNSYTTASLSTSRAYTVKVKNANNCESNSASGSITVNYPGTNGQPAHATCGCATGTTNCNGACTTTGTYTKNDGTCTGACKTAYVQKYNQCNKITDAKYSTYTNNNCSDGCEPVENTNCWQNCLTYGWIEVAACKARCSGYTYYARHWDNPDLNATYYCCCCN
jgi:hypothetical protein